MLPSMGGVLEREEQLEAIARGLDGARHGAGSAIVLVAQSGAGKSALLDHARQAAEARGISTLHARGTALEREFPFGIVRQLFDRLLHTMPAERRTALLRGPARLAQRALDPTLSDQQPDAGDPTYALLHGLFWLTLELAVQQPLLLAVDDAQWADGASVRFLAHLVRRMDGVPALLLLTTDSLDPAEGMLGQIAADSHARVLAIEPLSAAAVGQLIDDVLARAPDEALV